MWRRSLTLSNNEEMISKLRATAGATLLRMIAGFRAPDTGQTHVGGKPMQGVPPNRRPVNLVLQPLWRCFP